MRPDIMDKVLIVDDESPRPAGVAEQFAEAIEDVTDGRVGAALLLEVNLEEVAPKILAETSRLQMQGDCVIGLLLDYSDRSAPHAGNSLIDDIMADTTLCKIPVVFYTGKHVQFSAAELVKKGARGVIRRNIAGGVRVKDDARKALDYFGVFY
jgi:hypothetical protein